MKSSQNSEKILVSLGSGLGSLVVAWLLKKQGKQLRGVYYSFFEDAARIQWVQTVEKKLGIPIQIVDVTPLMKEKVLEPWIDARRTGVTVSMRKLFQQNILFPKLFELKKSFNFDKVATGHFAVTQYDEVEQVMRIMRAVETDRDEAEFLLGRSQSEIASLELPLGTLPASMSAKIAAELHLGEIIPLSRHPIWKQLEEEAFSELGSEANRPYDVYGLAGEKISTVPGGLHSSVGEVWERFEKTPEQERMAEQKHYVVDVDARHATITIGTLEQRVIQKITLKSLYWFGRGDLKLQGLKCSMVWSNPNVLALVKIQEYEGHTAKAFLETPLRKEQADVFSGQTVLWVSGNEILGGAEVVSCE